MTKSNDAKTHQETVTIQDGNNAEPTILANHHSKKSSKFLAFVKTIVCLLVAGCLIYTVSINFQLNHTMVQQRQQLITQMKMLQQQQKTSEIKMDDTIKTINVSQEKLQNQLNIVDKNLQSTQQQHSYQSNDWLLLKSRYYLELAEINVHWSDNVQATIALLQQADAMLANVHDQRLFNIRQAIAKEIAQLQAMPKIDVTGLLSKVDAMQIRIATLPINQTSLQLEKDKTSSSNPATQSSWRDNFTKSMKVLEKLIIIRHRDEDIPPLPTPEYETVLRESIHINLQETQWAILQHDETLYQFALKQAINNINRSFQPSAASTIALIKQLNSLQQIHLIQQKPNLDPALSLLNQLIDTKNTQASEDRAPHAGESL